MPKGTVNKVFLLGRLGSDPQVKYTQSGKATVTLSLATNQTWKDSNGEKQGRTDWHRVVAYGRVAEICGEYLKKGSLIYIEGRLQTRQWEKDGIKHFITEVIMNVLEMIQTTHNDEQSPPSEASEEHRDLPDPMKPSVPAPPDDLPF